MRTWICLAAVLAVVGAACSKSSAPKPSEPRVLAYHPENIKAYTIDITAKTAPGAAAAFDIKLGLALAFAPTKQPEEIEARIRKLDLDATTGGTKQGMHLDGDKLTITAGDEPPTVIKRGEPGPIDVGAVVDKPFTALEFKPGKVQIKTLPDHPMSALGGNLLDNALVLFPDLPLTPIAPGSTWSIMRNVAVTDPSTRMDVTYRFKYVDDRPCPTEAKQTCAHFSFDAKVKDVKVTTEVGAAATVSYDFSGEVLFAAERGVVDDSQVKMHADVDVSGMKMPMDATFVIRPTAG